MEIEKLIEQLNDWNENLISELCADDKLTCDDLCDGKDCIVVRAATALSTLQSENEKLRDEVERQRRSADNRQHLYENAERAYMKVLTELEQVKRERDAAIESWRGFCAKCTWNGKQYLSDGKMDDRCKTCRDNNKCNWEWRGPEEG